MTQQAKIIDGDGHIFEDGDAIARHFPYSAAGARLRSGVFPLNSHIQYSLTRTPPGAFATTPDGRFQNPGAEGWMAFMDEIGIDHAVLFPTAGQRIGRIVDRDYACGAARAYNDWLAEAYLRRDSRFKGIAILPMHDADAALEELQQAYNKLGMCAVLFPATGVHLNLGAKHYWPVYAEAARLGCPVVVHGGGHWDLGMDTMNVSTGANAIGHPMSLAIALAEMLLNNLFDRFPGLRVAYLEGGPLWFLMAIERLSRSYEAGTPINPRGELLRLQEGQTVADYIRGLVKAGRLVVGIEGGESDLPYAVKVAGEHAYMFSSDFPHEVNVHTVRKEIRELQENEALTEGAKQAILRSNAARFYGLDSARV
ncbi:MAG TPA: amidohydrolase family protein [Candidatus Limnocylindria bacterium]|nr:amidohydrolase family protein [Candidatus Limnocylindria bacterium]